VLVWTLLWLSF